MCHVHFRETLTDVNAQTSEIDFFEETGANESHTKCEISSIQARF